MKRLLLSLVCAALMASSALPVAAEDAAGDAMQPLLLLRLKSFEELTGDLDFIGGLNNNPDLGGGIEGLLEMVTGGQGLESMDASKPWGLSISSDGLEFQILGFLPIKDLEQFLQTVGNVAGGAEELGDGVWQLSLQGISLCFKQHGDWAYVSLSPDFLKNLPDDPTVKLVPADATHDLAAEVHVQNIPEIFRQLLMDQVKQMATQALEQQAPPTENGQLDLRQFLMDRQFSAIAVTMNELDVVRFGGSIDREARKGKIDIQLQAVKDSELAKKMDESGAAKSQFSGFLLRVAALALNLIQLLTTAQTNEAKATVEELRAKLLAQVESIGAINEQGLQEKVTGILNEMVDLAFLSSLEAGYIDAGFALVGNGPFTLIAGGSNPKAAELQKLLDRVIDMLETEVGFYGFQKDVAKHKEVRFHSASVPLPGGEMGDQLTNLFGFDIELTFAIGPNSAYMALGAGGVDHLKRAIDQSEANQAVSVPPLQATVKVAPLAKLMAEAPDADPNMKTIAAEIEAGKDTITVVGDHIPGGMEIHIEAAESLLKVLPAVISTVGLPAGLPGF